MFGASSFFRRDKHKAELFPDTPTKYKRSYPFISMDKPGPPCIAWTVILEISSCLSTKFDTKQIQTEDNSKWVWYPVIMPRTKRQCMKCHWFALICKIQHFKSNGDSLYLTQYIKLSYKKFTVTDGHFTFKNPYCLLRRLPASIWYFSKLWHLHYI